MTSCSQKHAYRAKGTFKLKGKKFPTSAQFQRIANRQCPKIAGPKWLATPPSEAGFKDGFRFVICSTKTSR